MAQAWLGKDGNLQRAGTRMTIDVGMCLTVREFFVKKCQGCEIEAKGLVAFYMQNSIYGERARKFI